MAHTSTVVVLANSKKKGGRCVAGKLIDSDQSGVYRAGAWVRPIDPAGEEGTISPATTSVGGSYLTPLDIVEIPLEAPSNDPHHPEDCIIAGTAWRKVGRAGASQIIPAFCDDPLRLWGAQSAVSRRVPVGFVPQMDVPSTLRLVQPTTESRIHGFMDEGWEGRPPRPKIRLSLSDDGLEHSFDVTDIAFLNRTEFADRVRENQEYEIVFKDPTKVAFCLSLTPPFKGYQYKIAAAIIELP